MRKYDRTVYIEATITGWAWGQFEATKDVDAMAGPGVSIKEAVAKLKRDPDFQYVSSISGTATITVSRQRGNTLCEMHRTLEIIS